MQSDSSFRVLAVNCDTGGTRTFLFGTSADHFGGSGLAAALFERFRVADAPLQSPSQPMIIAVGPLTGLYPLMSKAVCGFVSPHTGQYAESHAGGRVASALRRAGYHALVVTGRASRLSCLVIDDSGAGLRDVARLAGKPNEEVHSHIREMLKGRMGQLSVTCTGPAADSGCTFACATVDRYRHFGRLGAGASLGARNIKAIAILGNGGAFAPESSEYLALKRRMYREAAQSPKMDKYRGYGTSLIVSSLNVLGVLPTRNLTATSLRGAEELSGERMAETTQLRKAACSGCNVGCIRLAPFIAPDGSERRVGIDFEHMATCGTMIGLADPTLVLSVIDEVERQGVDVMSAGGCLAWAAEAYEKGLIGLDETVVPLAFGDAVALREGVRLMGVGHNEFYRTLARGAAYAASIYGGEDFACVLGQEMAGYAPGPVFFAAQAMNFRHSHLDNACYSYDLEHGPVQADTAVADLMRDEARRVTINCMVACMFARHIYTDDVLAQCLEAAGHSQAATSISALTQKVQAERWRLKLATGFDPDRVKIPKRFTQVQTGRGPVVEEEIEAVRKAYADHIRHLVKGA